MQKPKNMAAKIPQAFEERIVELSLQHPDFGARRLVPLLKAEEIVVSASKIHATLKRRGLNTRAKRYAKLKERHVSDIQPNKDGDLPSTAEEIPPTEEAAGVMAASFGDSAGPERHRKRAVRAPWFLTLFGLMLLALIIVLGIHTLQKAGSVGFAPVAEAAIETDPLEAASVRHSVTRPLSTYRAIWQRDLFKTNIKKQPEPKEEISVEDLLRLQKTSA